MLPTTIDAITPEWLGPRLADAGLPGDLVAVQAELMPTGRLGQTARLILSHAGEPSGPPSVIAKLPTTDPGGHELGVMLGMWERESRAYAEITEQTPVRTPACYVNERDVDAGHYVLVIEDFPEARVADRVAGASLSDAQASIDTLAAIHGYWWDHPALPSMDWLLHLIDSHIAILPRFGSAWPHFAQRFAAELRESPHEWLLEWASGYEEWLTIRQERVRTLVHGDYKLSNLLYDTADPIVVIDWQAGARGWPGYDVAQYLAHGLPTRLLADHGDELIDRYLEGLATRGVPEDELTTVRADIKPSLALVLAGLVIGYAMLVPDSPTEEADQHATIERLLSAAHVWGLDDSMTV